jgi:dihydroorotase
VMMLQEVHKGRISLEKLVEKMCHAPAECFRIPDRGYLDEGVYADLVVVDPDTSWTISKEELLYKCGWSPLEGDPVKGRIDQTYVNGQLVFDRGRIVSDKPGKRLVFTPLS